MYFIKIFEFRQTMDVPDKFAQHKESSYDLEVIKLFQWFVLILRIGEPRARTAGADFRSHGTALLPPFPPKGRQL